MVEGFVELVVAKRVSQVLFIDGHGGPFLDIGRVGGLIVLLNGLVYGRGLIVVIGGAAEGEQT